MKRGNPKIHGAVVLLSAVLMATLNCKQPKLTLYKKSRLAMDTLVSISLYAESVHAAERAFDAAFDEIARLEKMFNFYSEDSEIAKINRLAGVMPVKVSREVVEVIEKAIRVSEMTGGAFDVTVGALTEVWDFKNRAKPDAHLLNERKRLIGFGHIVFDKEKSTVFLSRKGVRIDAGGIVKGYAADRASDVLKKSGIDYGVVVVSGDIKAFGGKPDGSQWEIGVKQPVPGGGEKQPVAVLKLTVGGVSTSGDYERFFVKDGRLYHHLIDPQTGIPSEGGVRSVTVISDECALSDALSTGIFILGYKKGIELMERHKIKGVIVDRYGNVTKIGL